MVDQNNTELPKGKASDSKKKGGEKKKDRTPALRTYKHDIETLVEKGGAPEVAKKELERMRNIERLSKEVEKETYALRMREHNLKRNIKKIQKKKRGIEGSTVSQTSADIFTLRRAQTKQSKELNELQKEKEIVEEKGLYVIRARELYKKNRKRILPDIIQIATIIIPILLMVMGAFFLIGVFFFGGDNGVRYTQPTPRGTIFAELRTVQSISLPYERVVESLHKKYKPNTLNEIQITAADDLKRQISAPELFAYARITPPKQILHLLAGAYYFIGIHTARNNDIGFIFVGATQSHAATLESMRAWEIILPHDINTLFGTLIVEDEPGFVSNSLESIPVRMLATPSADGNVIYTVTEGGILIIATSETAFLEAARRVRTSIKSIREDVL